MTLEITDYFDIVGLVLQVVGFLLLLPTVAKMKGNRFGSETSETWKTRAITRISNDGGLWGISSILFGFFFEGLSLTINLSNH